MCMHILCSHSANSISGTWVFCKIKMFFCLLSNRQKFRKVKKHFWALVTGTSFENVSIINYFHDRRQSTSVKERQTKMREDQMFTFKSPKVNFPKLIPVISYASFLFTQRETGKIIHQFKFISFRDFWKVGEMGSLFSYVLQYYSIIRKLCQIIFSQEHWSR